MNDFKSESCAILNDVLIDLNAIELGNKSYNYVLQDFYEIMRKYGIKQGEKDINGIDIKYSPEWLLFLNIMREIYKSNLIFIELMDNIPEDLVSY